MDASLRPARKILTLSELVALRDSARRLGQTVVQCHGCFDLVHPGHVRHLQFAARQGDLLLVSVTGDGAMNKGAGRPLIPHELRAENLAALDCVDWVHIHPGATAEELLQAVQPDVYIKGREYETSRDPRFDAERQTVERHGGRVVFSSGDVVFSSTALIAALEEQASPFHARLRGLVEALDLSPKVWEPLIASFRGARVVVAGEAIIDTYIVCDRPEVAGESPVMTLRPAEWRSYDGGAAVVALHLAALGASPVLVTALPRSAEAEALRQRLSHGGVETRWVECDGKLLEKQRFLVGSQKVMKLDLVRPISLDAVQRRRLVALCDEAARGADAAILCDFGEGLLGRAGALGVGEAVRPHVEVLAGDVSGRRSDLLSMQGMGLLCPSESELRDALHDYDSGLGAAAWKLLERTRSKAAMVTMGADGLVAFSKPEDGGRLTSEHIPALALHAVDAMGCGDALLAATTLALLRKAPLPLAAIFGAVAAAAEAQKLGNAVIGASDLRQGLTRVAGGRLTIETKPLAQVAV